MFSADCEKIASSSVIAVSEIDWRVNMTGACDSLSLFSTQNFESKLDEHRYTLFLHLH